MSQRKDATVGLLHLEREIFAVCAQCSGIIDKGTIGIAVMIDSETYIVARDSVNTCCGITQLVPLLYMEVTAALEAAQRVQAILECGRSLSYLQLIPISAHHVTMH